MSRFYRVDKDGNLVELTREAPEARVHLQTDAGFEGLQASDGTDISSRTKWQQYMDARGLTMASDFKHTWEDAAKKRELRMQPGYGRQERMEVLKHVAEMNPRDVKNIAERARERAPNLPTPAGEGWE